MVENIVTKGEILVTSNFSFSHNVFHSYISLVREIVALCGNGLNSKSIIHLILYRKPQRSHVVCVGDMPVPVLPFDIDMDGESEEQFDKDFDQVISTMDSMADIDRIPDNLSLQEIRNKMKTDDVITPFQMKVNDILQSIDLLKYKTFCNQEYVFFSTLIQKITFSGPVKCKDLGDFYKSVHKYHTSAEFLMNCMQLFNNEIFSNEHKHICFFTSTEIRKFILDQCSKNYRSKQKQLPGRMMTNASRPRIRYVGGYCIAKLRLKYVKKKNAARYSKSPEDQQIYEECVIASEIIDQLQEDEQYILANSTDPGSLYDIYRKQNINRGLTNISDNLFHFFLNLSQVALTLMTTENFNKHGRDFFEHSKKELSENQDLLRQFSSVIQSQCVNLEESNTTRRILVNIFKKIVKSYLMILVSQFRKDLLDLYNVEKKMAHRKQIRVTVTNNPKKHKTVHNDDIVEKRKKRKGNDDKIMDTGPCTQNMRLQRNSPIPSTSTATDTHTINNTDRDADDDNSLCKICFTQDRDNQWIQCEGCFQWLHRTCAGLKHHLKWKKYQKKGSTFICSECQ